MKKNISKGKVTNFIDEFKNFIQRGSVIDLTVGVIIGGAFNKIVTSMVNDILMPIIGVLIGGLDFKELKVTIGDATILYGTFIQNVIDFLIVALFIFTLVKLVNRFKKKETEEKAPPKKSEEVVLLEEIRDLLKKEKNNKK